MNVSTICKRDVVTVRPSDGIDFAAQVMRDRHVGYLVAVAPAAKEGGVKPVGVLTDRDIVVAVVAQKVTPRTISVEDVMTPQPITVVENASLPSALQQMRDSGIRRVPVVDGLGRLTGVLSLDDVVDVLATQLQSVTQLIQSELRIEQSLRM